MIVYCPTCANMLHVDRPEGPGEPLKFFCSTCAYVCDVTRTITKDARIKRKAVDDALADDEASWRGAATTQVGCPKTGCDSSRAAFIEVQIRSADEPATLFYRCVGCGHMWRDG